MRKAVAILITLLWWSGCARIPADRYGIDSVVFEGVERMDPEALGVCLATRERPRIEIQLGRGARPSCGKPPFDGDPVRLRLWRWFWTDWPLYDEFVLERDAQRILRWYEARGYFDARVLQTRIEPPSASASDTIDETTQCDRGRRGQGCETSITFVIDEGEPVLVSTVTLDGTDGLPDELVTALNDALTMRPGDRFDEYDFEAAKTALHKILTAASYARAGVRGQAQIDRANHQAFVVFLVEPGPTCVFGQVTVETRPEIPIETIREAAGIEAGQPYSPRKLTDAQQAVFDLGGLSSVRVVAQIPEVGNVVDVVVEAVPAQRTRFRIGVGVQSGRFEQLRSDTETVPQWDIHFSAVWEHRNLFGGLRHLRIEERPRIIFESPFPRIESVALGNILGLGFRQPAFLEPRTMLEFKASWDVGPDPYDHYFRHELSGTLDVFRYFFDRALFLKVGLGAKARFVPQRGLIVDDQEINDWFFSGFRQAAIIDLRDDEIRTTAGLYALFTLVEVGHFMPSSWDLFQVVPDVRGYVPLPLGFLLAVRFALGMTYVTWASSALDELDRNLGPTTVRLRGGGVDSNRGFLPAQLGDGPDGGVRRWLASMELRHFVTRNLILTLFADMGDVHRRPSFRFDYPQLAVGAGIGYITPVGQIRIDIGWRVPGAQVLAPVDDRVPGGDQSNINLGFVEFPGAVNFAIGNSF